MAWRWNIERGRGLEGAALATCAVFAALALWLLVRIAWRLVPAGDARLDAGAARVGIAANAPAPSSIAKWHLFGNTPAGIGGGGAGASTLALILRGTLAERDPAAGIAVIGDGAAERAFRPGEEISNGVKLARVYADRAVVVRGSVEETLTLTRDRNGDPGNVVRSPSAGASKRSASAPRTPGISDAAAPKPSFGAPATAPRAPAGWQQQMDRLRQNPEELAQRVQVVPVLDNGKLSGVRVAGGSDIALINQLGLRAGDVVTSVNGAPVDSLARGQQIFESLRTASSARVTVLRDGKPTDVTISLK
jgi:general secretion pathway protein C